MPRAALLERKCCAAFLALLVGVNQRRLDGLAFEENVLAEGTKAARATADLAEEYLEVVGATKAQPRNRAKK